MAIRRGSKVDCSFSSSSMTDMIFLLLVFMVLATTLINPNAIKVVLPQSTHQSKDRVVTTVTIKDEGRGQCSYYVNNEPVGSFVGIEKALQEALAGEQDPIVSLHADKSVAWDEIVQVMNIAKDNEYKLIAATQR